MISLDVKVLLTIYALFLIPVPAIYLDQFLEGRSWQPAVSSFGIAGVTQVLPSCFLRKSE